MILVLLLLLLLLLDDGDFNDFSALSEHYLKVIYDQAKGHFIVALPVLCPVYELHLLKFSKI